jgi:hypothetical protein
MIKNKNILKQNSIKAAMFHIACKSQRKTADAITEGHNEKWFSH